MYYYISPDIYRAECRTSNFFVVETTIATRNYSREQKIYVQKIRG